MSLTSRSTVCIGTMRVLSNSSLQCAGGRLPSTSVKHQRSVHPVVRQTAVSSRSSITLHDCTNLEASRLSPGKESFFSFPSITPRALRLYKRLIVSPKALKPEMILNDARFKIITAVLMKVQVF